MWVGCLAKICQVVGYFFFEVAEKVAFFVAASDAKFRFLFEKYSFKIKGAVNLDIFQLLFQGMTPTDMAKSKGTIGEAGGQV